MSRRRFVRFVVPVLAVLIVALGIGVARAGHHDQGREAGVEADHPGEEGNQPGEEGRPGHPETFEDVNGQLAWFYGPRMAPGSVVPGKALVAASHQAQALAARSRADASAAWTSLGPQPINSADSKYRDPTGEVFTLGWHDVSGRVTALAVDPNHSNTVYMGAADGGVWKTKDGGTTWTSVADSLDTLSIGAVAIDPANSKTIYVGTGEDNYSSDSYYGSGIYRSKNGGGSWTKIGGSTFDQATIIRILFPKSGRILAATNHGLYRSTDSGTSWTRTLAPGGTTDLYGNIVSDAVMVPGTGGKQVLAAVGWRSGDASNGLWLSTNGGKTFSHDNGNGFAPQSRIGRVSLASSDAQPGLFYAVVQDAVLLNEGGPQGTVLNGVFRSTSGPSGPWARVATAKTLAADPNSALSRDKIGFGYSPGVQSWYNNYVQIDPTDPSDVILGLEEVYNSSDGGSTWQTIGRYWNFCFSDTPPNCNLNPNKHPTTHPDQHAAVFADVNGKPKLYVGNDGGVWSQTGPSWSNDDWTDLNATLSITQPYYVTASNGPNPTYYAGTQDNGNLKYTGSSTWPIVYGGDGGDVAVEPANPKNTYEEYVYLTMSKSHNGGVTWNSISPPDAGNPATARFIAPFEMDPNNPDHLVAVGEQVWDSKRGIQTTSASWKSKYDLGVGRVGTALAVQGSTMYVGWCGPCNPTLLTGDSPFAAGMATNYGGMWHAATGTLPNRFITSVTVDPSDLGHIYVTLSAFSRKWIPSAGYGHVFESTDGGATFTDISSNLPDAPANDSVLHKGKLIVGTDVGVYELRSNGNWSVLGTGLPPSSVLDLQLVPNSSTLVAATHGRGMYLIPLS